MRDRAAPAVAASPVPLTGVPDGLIEVGVVGAPHGVRGEVRLRSFTAEPVDIGRYGPLLTQAGRSLAVRVVRHLKDDLVVARIEGVGDRDQAAALTGTALFMRRDALPGLGDGEFYQADLVGLQAVDEAGAVIGRVAAVLDYGAGDILEVDRPGASSLLVAFTGAFVPAVDLPAGRVTLSAAALAGDES